MIIFFIFVYYYMNDWDAGCIHYIFMALPG